MFQPPDTSTPRTHEARSASPQISSLTFSPTTRDSSRSPGHVHAAAACKFGFLVLDHHRAIHRLRSPCFPRYFPSPAAPRASLLRLKTIACPVTDGACSARLEGAEGTRHLLVISVLVVIWTAVLWCGQKRESKPAVHRGVGVFTAGGGNLMMMNGVSAQSLNCAAATWDVGAGGGDAFVFNEGWADGSAVGTCSFAGWRRSCKPRSRGAATASKI
ncbi:uncharacterized protein UV8b_01823 [Ustilaginoidea virens]|uniref:Uncharacterized protein n=1 Tax=Ustilaginoidea virens TaxID=1159556 RepID=A0A8E5MFA8_USTVR|nr:uncharacterized protein UV8b_01823 [Ustilaginoidea virens]QUC17582.1 hypothetical protein UV8b_01823 [Ustilaginoidea virens]